jgi:glycosyltransferase involved in cell wall biosynthesis
MDRLTTVSDELARRLARDYGVQARPIHNGVDLSAYTTPQPSTLDLPAGGFAVYVGVVEERVDLDLLADLVRVLDIPVVVAGPARTPAAERLRATGARWLGPIPVHEVPGLLQRASIGLVPHFVTEFTASMNPMKVLEYLAAGLPVVSTDVPGLADISPEVVAVPRADFVAAVTRALAETQTGKARRRPDPGLQHRDWDDVASTLLGEYRRGS